MSGDRQQVPAAHPGGQQRLVRVTERGVGDRQRRLLAQLPRDGNCPIFGEPITTGTIVSVSGSTATNGSTAAITLAVPETDAGVLACYASAQDVAIALTPGSG